MRIIEGKRDDLIGAGIEADRFPVAKDGRRVAWTSYVRPGGERVRILQLARVGRFKAFVEPPVPGALQLMRRLQRFERGIERTLGDGQ